MGVKQEGTNANACSQYTEQLDSIVKFAKLNSCTTPPKGCKNKGDVRSSIQRLGPKTWSKSFTVQISRCKPFHFQILYLRENSVLLKMIAFKRQFWVHTSI